MKLRIFARPQFVHPTSTSGMALVLVLGMIVLLTVLVIGFLFNAGTQRMATASYQNTVGARQLSDTAVNLVQAQINDATMQGNSTAWASQPGALRVFDASGNLSRIYRLYSSTSLTGTASGDLDNDVPKPGWTSLPATWVDINEPSSFTDSSGTRQHAFPILDPRNPSDLTKTLAMPGFSLNSPPGASTTQPAPMPVRWLYILQDGKIVSPSAGTDGSNVTVTGASGTNPIVGRIAFWTDDETCKVNPNTAGGDDGGVNSASSGTMNTTAVAKPTFWDTPRFNTEQEKDFGRYQPAAGEFQRYPGHPATVALRPILSALGISPADSAAFYKLLPRYDFGGTEGATGTAAGPIALKSGRLYSSPGELLYTKEGTDQGVTRQQTEAGRFFLTTRSRAPELTLFGTPRIAIWPINDNSDNPYRTPIDNLIAFCSTVNGNSYHFTRTDPTSTTADINNLPRNIALLNYLDRLTKAEIPGFGGNFNTKYPADSRQILTEIFDYIRSSNLKDSTPAVGSTNTVVQYTPISNTSQGRYGQVSPITLTGTGTPSLGWETQGFGRFPRIIEATMVFVGMGSGTSGANDAIPVYPEQIVPSNQPDGEAVYSGTPASLDYWRYKGVVSGTTGIPPNNTTAVQAFFVLSLFDSNNGWCAMNPGLTIKVDGLDQFTLNSGSLGMKSSATIYCGYPNLSLASTSEARMSGGVFDIRTLFSARRNGDKPTNFPFYSFVVPVSNTTSAMTVGTASLTVSVYAGYPNNYTTSNPDPLDPAKLVQTYKLKFPQTDLPVPTVETDAAYAPSTRRFGSALATTGTINGLDRGRIQWAAQANLIYKSIISTKDSVLSLIPSEQYADYRQLACQTLPDTAFVPHPNSNYCGLTSGFTKPLTTRSSFGNLTGASYTTGAWPDLPCVPATAGASGVKAGLGTAPGDWDNGISYTADGAYINKADEGNIGGLSSGAIPYFNASANQVATATGTTYFSPNRQMPSAGMFGSLPTGVKSNAPWQTLLFRPSPTSHKGNDAPKDHLLLDLFWMPVAEPYPISEPLSTAGKVNLNYGIVPFTYITRSTALQAVLASQRVTKVPKSLAPRYKDSSVTNNPDSRFSLNLNDTNGTLRQFKEKFANGDVFKSASEICDIFLVPDGTEWTSDAAALSAWYGDDFAMVGDNSRERPYTYILPRVTTKSNVYTVYTRVQVLKNPLPRDQQNQWNENRGKVVGEYRGSTTLERFIDTNDTSLPDSATNAESQSLDTYYKWRVLEAAQFAP